MAAQGGSGLSVLARLLAEVRANQRLSISDLAECIGCDQSLLHRWLAGQCTPKKLDYLRAIAHLCGQSLESLQHLISFTTSPHFTDRLRKYVCRSLLQVKGPADLPSALKLLAAVRYHGTVAPGRPLRP